MSSLLSPGKPVLTHFKVPGEGTYSLAAELRAPVARAAPAATSGSGSTNKSSGGGAATPTAAGPLGLAHVTRVSYAGNASLAAACASQTVMVVPSPAASPVTSSSLFSLRKLTGLGSSFTSKFSSANPGTDEEPRSWMGSTAPVVSVPALRAPPRAALDGAGGTDSGVPIRTGSAHSVAVDRDSSPLSNVVDAATEGTRCWGRGNGTAALGIVVYNAADCICALDMPESNTVLKGAPARTSVEPSLMLSVRSAPTAHALLGHEKPQLLVGCANGEIIYYPDISTAATSPPVESGKRARGSTPLSTISNGSVHPAYYIYNRDGAINSTRVVAVRWVPGSSYKFVAAHVDATLVVYDTRQKPHSSAIRAGPLPSSPADCDVPTTQNSASGPAAPTNTSLSLRPGNRDNTEKSGGDKPDPNRDKGSSGGSSEKSIPGPGHRRTGSTATGGLGQHELSISRVVRKKNQAVTVWQLGCGIITDVAFSPARGKNDTALLAVCGRDGYLRVLDFGREAPLIAFRSYFGALLCVSWSPDGRYVAAGGEDDLVSVWCPGEERIVARLEGHTSWVSAVAWDGRVSGGGRYRLGSAGQDTKLLLWDFEVHMLHTRTRPTSNMVRLRSYAREPAPPVPERRAGKLARLRAHASAHSATHGSVTVDADSAPTGTVSLGMPTVVGALGRAVVPMVGPVVAHIAHAEPLTDVAFQETGIVTADAAGNVKVWSRPPSSDVPPLSLTNKEDAREPTPPGSQERRPRPQRGTVRADSRRSRNADLD